MPEKKLQRRGGQLRPIRPRITMDIPEIVQAKIKLLFPENKNLSKIIRLLLLGIIDKMEQLSPQQRRDYKGLLLLRMVEVEQIVMADTTRDNIQHLLDTIDNLDLSRSVNQHTFRASIHALKAEAGGFRRRYGFTSSVKDPIQQSPGDRSQDLAAKVEGREDKSEDILPRIKEELEQKQRRLSKPASPYTIRLTDAPKPDSERETTQ